MRFECGEGCDIHRVVNSDEESLEVERVIIWEIRVRRVADVYVAACRRLVEQVQQGSGASSEQVAIELVQTQSSRVKPSCADADVPVIEPQVLV